MSLLALWMKSLLQKTDQQFKPSGTQKLIMDILQTSREMGEINADFPIERMFGFIDYMRTVMVLDWLKDSSRVNLREETVRLVDLVLYGAFSRPEKKRNNHSLRQE